MMKLTEFIVKYGNISNDNFCNTLSDCIVRSRTSGDVSLHLTDDLVKQLVQQLQDIYVLYKRDCMPDVPLNDNGGFYTIELDTLDISNDDESILNLGGAGKSQRFVVVMLVLDRGQIHFTAQDAQVTVSPGDILAFPPYVNHRFTVSHSPQASFKAINTYACMHY